MRIISERKHLFSIIGLGQSGTTIIGNFFNSIENVFCASEPHLLLMANNRRPIVESNTGITFTDVKMIVHEINEILICSPQYQAGGVKETIASHHPARKLAGNLILKPIRYCRYMIR